MTVQLFELDEFPNKIAVSKVDSFVTDGAFFLDFSRPIQIQRWFGIPNSWFGISRDMLVPVVHQGEENGGYVISVERSEPQYKVLRTLWKQHYPSEKYTPSNITDGIHIVANFGAQFPEDSQ